MIAKCHFAGHAHALRFGLDAGELDPLVDFHQLHALQRGEKVEMPPGAAKLAVGDHRQAAGALGVHTGADGIVFNLTQRCRVNRAAGELFAGRFDGIRT